MKKLSYLNNWESDEYYVGDLRVITLERVSIDGIEFDVFARKVSVSYNDHGYEHISTSMHFFITTSVGHIEFERDLNELVNKSHIVIPLIWS